MSAKKPVGLLSYHQAKSERNDRASNESALRPKDPLTTKPPTCLAGHPVASSVWRVLVKIYQGLESEIVSLLDQGLLVDYCMLQEQLVEIDRLRTIAMRNYNKSQMRLDRIQASKKFPDLDPKKLQLLIKAVNRQMDLIIKLDARADRKRAHLHTLRQSLYMTPRSRAGVAPSKKPPEKPKTEMEKLLDAPKYPGPDKSPGD